MQDDISQTAESIQAGAIIQIRQNGYCAGSTPGICARGVAQQGIDAIALSKVGEDAAGDIAAADNQNILHLGIVAEASGEEMSYQITVQPSGRQFASEAGETLLDAALRQGLTLPHGCKDGACGACKGKVISGQVDHGKAQSHALKDEDKAAGMTLYCCAQAESDLIIECKQVGAVDAIPARTLPSRIEKLEKLAPDVIELQLRLPANERLQFFAGQYIDILLKDGKKRSFSLANAPEDEGLLQLHIRHVPGGLFTDQVFGSMKARDILRFNGPHGSFYLREDSTKPLILLAGGTGFAPIKAIVEHAILRQIDRPIYLYWGAKAVVDLYQNALPEQWAAAHPTIKYIPVLSEPAATDDWHGRTGFAHHAVIADFPNLSGYQVYACGSPVMIDSAKADLVSRCQLPEEEFFADIFSYSAS
jgi:CDP-4-dehydro-6-deoxyglucose reductase